MKKNKIIVDNKQILTEEKQNIFKYIVESYIEEGYPIGSNNLVEKYNLNISSSKVRYIMNELEKLGFLEKTHTSSGRIPSNKGYEYYANNIVTHDVDKLRDRVKDLFAKRRVNIDATIQEAANAISEAVGLTLITSQTNEDATLKSIQLVPLTKNEGTIILVTSYGEVTHKTITLDLNKVNMEDLRISIRIFKERLIDIPILKLKSTAESLKPILSQVVKNYESIMESFVNNIFDFELKNENIVYGKSNIILADDISRPDLTKILNLIETKSIWQTIEANTNDDDPIKISIRNDNSTFITKKIAYDGKIKEIALVGSKRMNYEKGLTALQMLEDLIANKGEK
ncbi:heat-inducible transcriptional repressor HrcA [Mycoplasmopsis lipofaciens]|uniref:heat-inducible transcriptional repressor HrcA n=1 Tax=Mycoplasmopsis lipofaciens TaxID=114884 RepID=UPI00068A2C15|nr:heat-inducible transcriptional repressor HrcA [Mycoplasmopsis lipofaciens]